MTEKVKCANKECERMILLETAEKTGGICMPCKQANDRREREKYISENRKDVNLYEGVDDRVEIIKIMHLSLAYDPLVNYVAYPTPINEIYDALSEHEEKRLLAYIEKTAAADGIESVEYMALELAAFRNADFSGLQKLMLGEHVYYPSLLFNNASSEIVNELLSRLESEPDNRNHILLALAWAGSVAIVQTFSHWMKTPPAWSEDLYIPPQDYAKDAGWELTGESHRRNLYFEQCYPLVGREKSPNTRALSTCTRSEQTCHWCGRKLTNLLEMDLSDSLFGFLPIKGERLTVATCDACSSYADALFMEITTSGETKWSEYNKKPGFLPDDSDSWEYMPVNCLGIAREQRAPDYAANEFLPTRFSQIGGMPTWIQDFAYPACPKCKNTMMFLAQISNEDIDEYSEGIYYNYICPDCNITATNYQQT